MEAVELETMSKQGHEGRLRYDRYVRYFFFVSALLMTVIIASIIIFVGQQGLQTFLEVSPWEFFFSSKWDPVEGSYGALSFILGSVYVTLLAVVLGAPLGLGGAVFMAKVAPKWLRDILKPAVGLYMAIPSVVYGFIGLTVVVPFVREFFQLSTGFGLFTAGAILAIMILPTVISISEDALQAVPRSLEEASLALGATRWQTIWRVTLNAAKPGIFTAVIFGMARAFGEALAIQMVVGNSAVIPTSLTTPAATLTSVLTMGIGNTVMGTVSNNVLWSLALVLLLMSLGFNMLVKFITRERKRNYER